MGSGHFLVTAVDFLSDYIAEMVEHAPGVPEWLDGEYVSPLVERVAAIRQDIAQRAQAADWVMDQAQLTDQSIIPADGAQALHLRSGQEPLDRGTG